MELLYPAVSFRKQVHPLKLGVPVTPGGMGAKSHRRRCVVQDQTAQSGVNMNIEVLPVIHPLRRLFVAYFKAQGFDEMKT